MTSRGKQMSQLRKSINIQSIITILTLACLGLFWLYTINGVPNRVQTLETKVEMIEKSIVKNETQSELILNAIYEIRNNIQNITLNMNNNKRNVK